MTKALVTCGGGFQGLGMVKALRHIDGMHVTVCDIHTDNPTRYACHEYLVCPPLADAKVFEAFLLDTVKQRGIEVVFPATALELCTLADLQSLLHELGAIAAVSSRDLLKRLLDKRETRRFLDVARLPMEVPIDPHTHDFSFPLLGKPRHGWGGRDTLTLVTHADMQDAAAILDAESHVWSRRFDTFEEYSADFAIGVAGAISPIVVRRRVRTSGGFAVISESVRQPELDALFARLASSLAQSGGLGCFNAQVIVPRMQDCTPFISDINPRLGTSATHALAEGVNLPGFFVANTRGERPTAASRTHVKNVRLLQDLPLPRLSRRPRALVLDLDDTLVDHKRWLFAKMERLYTTCFHDLADENTYRLAVAQLIDEHDWPRLIDRTLELLSLPASMRATAIEAYRAIEVDTPLFDDVAPVLAALTNGGIRLAVLTDNPPVTQRAKLANAPALAAIERAIFSRECGHEKPHMAGFAAVTQALGLSPGELVMVGDNWFRDGVGAIGAGYAHALIVQREATSLSDNDFRAQTTPAEITHHIHLLPSLTCVQHACLDAPA